MTHYTGTHTNIATTLGSGASAGQHKVTTNRVGTRLTILATASIYSCQCAGKQSVRKKLSIKKERSLTEN